MKTKVWRHEKWRTMKRRREPSWTVLLFSKRNSSFVQLVLRVAAAYIRWDIKLSRQRWKTKVSLYGIASLLLAWPVTLTWPLHNCILATGEHSSAPWIRFTNFTCEISVWNEFLMIILKFFFLELLHFCFVTVWQNLYIKPLQNVLGGIRDTSFVSLVCHVCKIVTGKLSMQATGTTLPIGVLTKAVMLGKINAKFNFIDKWASISHWCDLWVLWYWDERIIWLR